MKLGLFYGSNEEGNLLLRKLVTLSFFKWQKIEGLFMGLEGDFKNKFEGKLYKLWEWIRDNYVLGIARGRGRSGVRKPPIFEPKFWSVFDAIEYNYPRTQNNLEGWHNRWGDLIKEKHVGIIRFLHTLREEQKYCNRKIIDIERGELFRIRIEEEEREKKLRKLHVERNARILANLLTAFAHNLNFSVIYGDSESDNDENDGESD